MGARICVSRCLSRGMLCDRRESVKVGEFARLSMGKFLVARHAMPGVSDISFRLLVVRH